MIAKKNGPNKGLKSFGWRNVWSGGANPLFSTHQKIQKEINKRLKKSKEQ